jgi:branched-chain amino acid aminotransferase
VSTSEEKNLGFSLHPTDFMYVAQTAPDMRWNIGTMQPFGDISLSPAAVVLNYGQAIFEGIKAQYNSRNEIIIFRLEANAQRFASSAKSLSMPIVSDEMFIDAVKSVVKANAHFIPPYNQGSLYIRPLLIGSGSSLGAKPASEYQFIVYCSPVGAYFKNGLAPMKAKICEHYHRSAPLGTGHAKYAGNYAGCFYHNLQAKKEGYDGCLFLDAKESKYLEEIGSANLFLVKGNKLITPELGSILPGITRDSIMMIAKEILSLEVEERRVAVEELATADECFCTGTAVVITPVGTIRHQDQYYIFNNNETGPITQKLYSLYRAIQSGEQEDRFCWITKVTT